MDVNIKEINLFQCLKLQRRFEQSCNREITVYKKEREVMKAKNIFSNKLHK